MLGHTSRIQGPTSSGSGRRPAEVVRVPLDSVVERLDPFAVQKTQDTLLELSSALAQEISHKRRLLGDGFVEDGSECALYLEPRL
jgi:hypothetical protein